MSLQQRKRKETPCKRTYTLTFHLAMMSYLMNKKTVIEEGEAREQRNTVPFSFLAAELEGYMNMPNIEENENPFIWWKQQESSFPRISQLAKQYLSMPASSVCRCLPLVYAQNGSFQKLGTFLKKNALDFCLEMAKYCFFFITI